jgi:phi13 family phage major tail protein
MANKGVTVGLSSIHIALLLTDEVDAVPTYETAISIPGAIKASLDPKSSLDTLFAEDGPYDTATTLGQVSLDLNVADLSLEMQSIIFGHAMSNGILIRKSTDTPPWLAVGFRALKSNGSYRYTWLAKGKFSLPKQDSETKSDKINFQTPTTTGNFVKRDSDNEWERHTDEDSTTYDSAIGAKWFNGPLQTASTSSTTLSITTTTPLTDATAAGADVLPSVTFNEAILSSSANIRTIFLMNSSTGSSVSGTVTVSTDSKTVTFTPGANLAVGTVYIFMITTGVSSIAGTTLSASYSIHFTA